MGRFVHFYGVSLVETHSNLRALLYETEGLVVDRVRQMLTGEGFATCSVDDLDLFHELRLQVSFDLFIVGVRGFEALDLRLSGEIQPLVLLAPGARQGAVAHYRMALPDAMLVDRALRDPDTLRRALGTTGPSEPASSSPDTVRSAFLPFGLSERQLEVLSGALMGDRSRDIARKLFISELTVRNHLHAIYERVGVSGRRELLGRFVQGLIEGQA